MNALKTISRTKRNLTISAALLAGVLLMGDDLSGQSFTSGGYPASQRGSYAGNVSAAGASNPQNYNYQPMNSPGKAVLYDQGLQMPIGSYTLPEGWTLSQDIATDPATNQPIRYSTEIKGPRGEVIRSLGSAQYGYMEGRSFEQTWGQLAMTGLQGDFQQISFGALQPDPQALQSTMKYRIYQRLVSQGTQVQCLQSSVSGYRNGQAFSGVVTIVHLSNQAGFGTIAVGVGMAPASEIDQFTQIRMRISDSYQVNPAYEQRREQLQAGVLQRNNAEHNRWMAVSQQGHQQRMANMQSSYASHQQNMASMNQAQDASFNGYMERSRNSNPSVYGDNNYTGQDAYIDMTHGRSTYENPDTGYNVSLDGYEKFTYTDGLGNYHRTDDPNFDPKSLPGNWRKVDPRTPNY